MLKKILNSLPRATRICKRNATCCNPGHESDIGVKLTSLPNDVMIATEVREYPLTCVSLSIVAGSRYETVFNNGMSHFIEHMAFKRFRTWGKTELEVAAERMGARITMHTARDLQVFSVVLPTEHAPSAVEILFKFVSELRITQEDIMQEQDNIRRELADSDANPAQLLFDYLHATAFQGTPLAQRVIGTSKNIARFDVCMLTKFMCENYVPYRMCLSSSGGARNKHIVNAAAPLFGSLCPVPNSEPELGPSRFTGSQVAYRDDSMPFCHVAIAFEAPGFMSSEFYKWVAMKYMMGSWDRSQGRDVTHASPVVRQIAMEKICESYKPFYLAYRDVGLWGVYFIADKWKLDEVMSYIQHQFMAMCTTVSDTELQRACNVAKLNMARRYSSAIWSSRDIGRQLKITCRRRSLEKVYSEVCAVSVSEVKSIAYRFLYDKCPAVASVGPSETLPDYIRIRSGMWWLRL